MALLSKLMEEKQTLQVMKVAWYSVVLLHFSNIFGEHWC